MERENRPRGREKNITQNGSGAHRRGGGLGTGPVGSGDGYSSRNDDGFGRKAAARGGSGSLIVIVLFLLFKFFFGGTTSGENENSAPPSGGAAEQILQALSGPQTQGSNLSPSQFNAAPLSSGVNASDSRADESVAAGSRAKYTKLLGGKNDSITMMVYMCGTDLESQHGMASSDLAEMAKAELGDKINLIVYTGGCKQWKIDGISNSANQIFQVKDGKLKALVKNDGAKKMTDPATLSAFIKWGAKNFPASRNILIFWDHGGGSISGYGYDEKFPSSGSMDLNGINKALKAGGVKFDFVGFDACLMATAETALMLNSHADYMIASEETEPGIGWHYTNWLARLASDTALHTVRVGKLIADDFVSECALRCPGQQTTLSVIDLAEFSNTIPNALSAFSKSVSAMIAKKEYKKISDARYVAREFARSSRIDQVDLVHLCKNIGNEKADALALALQKAVKYNKTSSNMTDAYGVSIYFPYQRVSKVDQACDTYSAIGMDQSYSECIREFASLEVSGQVAAGGASSPASSLFDMLSGGSDASSSDAIGQLLGAFLGGSSSGGTSGLTDILISGLTAKNKKFLQGRAFSSKDTAQYISTNRFDKNDLFWKNSGEKKVLAMSERQWSLVHALDLNMFYDDGNGWIDLGLDNVYEWTEDGSLLAPSDKTWISINGQPVAYYHADTTESESGWSITGRVPILLNGKRANLWLCFDKQKPKGYVLGTSPDYKEATLAVAKTAAGLKPGDKIDFLCDYYSYDGKYQDSYFLGDPLIVTEEPLSISDTIVGQRKARAMFRFTDIYNQEYWSEATEL